MFGSIKRKRSFVIAIVAVLLVICFYQGVAIACPTCKDGITSDAAQAGLIRGYFWSIVFMMSMPFLILAGLGSYFYYEIRRARAQQAKLAASSSRETLSGVPATTAAR